MRVDVVPVRMVVSGGIHVDADRDPGVVDPAQEVLRRPEVVASRVDDFVEPAMEFPEPEPGAVDPRGFRISADDDALVVQAEHLGLRRAGEILSLIVGLAVRRPDDVALFGMAAQAVTVPARNYSVLIDVAENVEAQVMTVVECPDHPEGRRHGVRALSTRARRNRAGWDCRGQAPGDRGGRDDSELADAEPVTHRSTSSSRRGI